MKHLPLVLALVTTPALPCTLIIEYTQFNPGWLSGFRIYQDGVETGTVAPGTTSVPCVDVGLVPGLGPVTATAYRGTEESPQSDPATFVLQAPSAVTVEFRIPGP